MGGDTVEDSLHTQKKEITLSSSGKSKDEAISKIFSSLKGVIYNEIKKPIVYMNTENVYIENIEDKKYVEKFLFIFMPREKREYKITLKINVLVKYINI